MDTTPDTLAKECLAMLETRKRNNGESFKSFKDWRPDWMQELAHHAHGDMLPDDQRYEMIAEALFLIAECESEDQFEERLSEIEADPYTSDRLAWLSSRNDRAAYVNDTLEEYGQTVDGNKLTLEDAIGIGQVAERQEVARLVWEYLTERAEELQGDAA